MFSRFSTQLYSCCILMAKKKKKKEVVIFGCHPSAIFSPSSSKHFWVQFTSQMLSQSLYVAYFSLALKF